MKFFNLRFFFCLMLMVLLIPKKLAAQLQLQWQPLDSLNAEIPDAVRAFETNTPLPDGGVFNAQCVRINLNDPQVDVSAVYSKLKKTPQQLASGAMVAINGGFFGKSINLSTVVNDGKWYSVNVPSVTRSYQGENTAYYPTRGAFGLVNRQADVAWIYHNTTDSLLYEYSLPAPNQQGEAPAAKPSDVYPEGAKIWDADVAMGGAPVLVTNGKVNVTANAELIQVNNDKREPRSAIGYTTANELLLVVVNGRQPELSMGITLPELAQLMVELGAVEALNLDGGGSSCLVVNGQVISHPSDKTGPRPVPSALLVHFTN
ncbi:phosphodiester glycosidase family protein [Marinoscillum furvescens]|uniref:Uncharacterized protein DUF2233 n=1 Tax=Marinoscillum furvescens DSM 4134 TaxID=1122208 RepID=A0A3D9KWZ8_MARFU|nr:phosphodiester glycosidase family protein [Marinoscillum furvescens]RED91791.1 uncharacterized protein DUF2233 [Marinoscillum furvescens DSM 4134]